MGLSQTRGSIFRKQISSAAIGGCAIALAACGDSVVQLWTVSDEKPSISSPQTKAAVEADVDVGDLRSAPERITLPLPGARSITAVLTGFEKIGEDQFIWRGRIDGESGGIVRLSVVEDTIVGDISTADGSLFRIRQIRTGRILVEELDPTRIPREEATDPDRYDPAVMRMNPATGRLERILKPSPDMTTYVDVLVLYTASVAGVELSVNGVRGRINTAISDTSDSLKNSEVKQRLRLAHAEQTSYVESDDPYLDWSALKGRSSIAAFSGLDQLRSDHGADVVVLLTNEQSESGSCGQADQMHDLRDATCLDAFAVVPINCATTTHSFAHEIGHVMGADHNNEALVFSPPFKHSRGFIAPSNKWRTIMSYETTGCTEPACQRILHWSNPSVWYAEEAATGAQQAPQAEQTGSEAADAPSNNAATLKVTADVVAKYSNDCAVVPQPSA